MPAFLSSNGCISSSPKTYTFRQLVRLLTESGIDDATTEAKQIVEALFDVPVEVIPAEPNRIWSSERLDSLLSRRIHDRIPLAYLLGKVAFWRGEFYVDENCLIPRRDTELLVETAIRLIPRHAHFADLCTGSGCVGISILGDRTDTQCLGVDIQDSALQISKKNAALNHVANRFSPLLHDVCDTHFGNQYGTFDAVVCNPPYIPRKVIPKLAPEVLHEPVIALNGGNDGLDFYRILIGQYATLIQNRGPMIFEIGYDQGPALMAIAENQLLSCQIFQDLEHRDRVALIQR